MASFCKKKDCPPSQEIFEVSVGKIVPVRCEAISQHFCECEFCRAELEFYRHYPPAAGTVQFQEIPAPLFQLATSLLERKRDLTPLYKLMNSSA